MNEISKYQIVWVEFRATTGIVTKADQKVLLKHPDTVNHKRTRVFEHFDSLQNAATYVAGISRSKLSKKYEVRTCTDAQFSAAEYDGSDIIVKYTEIQEQKSFTI